MLVTFSGLNPKGPCLSLEKGKETSCVVFNYSVKWAREMRKFHVAVVQRWLTNVHEGAMHVQSVVVLLIWSYCFFCRSRCRRRHCCLSSLLLYSKKFCYHGNMMSHFPCLLNIKGAFISVTLLDFIHASKVRTMH